MTISNIKPILLSVTISLLGLTSVVGCGGADDEPEDTGETPWFVEGGDAAEGEGEGSAEGEGEGSAEGEGSGSAEGEGSGSAEGEGSGSAEGEGSGWGEGA